MQKPDLEREKVHFYRNKTKQNIFCVCVKKLALCPGMAEDRFLELT